MKRKKSFGLCILGIIPLLYLFGHCLFSQSNSSEKSKEQLDQHHKEIIKLWKTGNHQDATSKCKYVIESGDSTFVRIYPLLIKISKEEAQLGKTIQYFRNLLKKNAENPYFLYALGLGLNEKM